jgi:hypothetical protein
MSTHKHAEDFLKEDCADRFQDKRKFFGLFGAFVYKPTGEKVEEDFGYFDCEIAKVLDAFNRQDLAAMAEFPLCDSEHRGSVRVDLFHTASGSMVALQIVEYQNYNPTPVTPVILLEGDAAKAALGHVKSMIESD